MTSVALKRLLDAGSASDVRRHLVNVMVPVASKRFEPKLDISSSWAMN